jgi:acetyl esterase/lipase
MVDYERFPEDTTFVDGMKTLESSDDDLGTAYIPNIEYEDVGGTKRVLQIITPYKRTPHKFPLLVYIQGSAWMKQDVYAQIPQLGYLARKGFVVASVQYRESEIAPFPAQVQDVKAAIRFLRKNADKYNIQENNVFVWGDSSGGHTALLVGLTENCKELDTDLYPEYSCHVNGIISFYGVIDIRMTDGFPSTDNHQQPDSPEGMLLGRKNVLENPELAAKTLPFAYLDGAVPPILLMHGTKDRIVSFKHGVRMYEALKRAGKEVEFYRVRNADHGDPAFFRDSTLDIVADFIRRHLQPAE